MKKFFCIIITLFGINNVFAEIIFTIEIHNVLVNRGIIHLGVYFNEQSFRNENPDISMQIEPINNIIIQEITLPEGEFVIGIHQDISRTGSMDFGLFGIPREPFGFTNMRGKIPGNFN